MAIDTRDKRAAASCLPFMLSAFPLADAAIGQSDRQHATWVYSGITVGAAVAAATGDGLLWLLRRRRRYWEPEPDKSF